MFDNAKKSLNEFATRTIKRAKEILNTPNALGLKNGRKKSNTGRLADSLGSSLIDRRSKFTVSFLSSADYASIVEEGRDKGAKMPPSGPLDRWIVQRNIKGSRDAKGRFVKRKSLNFLIRRSISRKGIKAFPFMKTAMNEEFDKYPSIFQKALIEDMEDVIFDNFQKSKFVTASKT